MHEVHDRYVQMARAHIFKGNFTQEYNLLLEVFPQSQHMEISYDGLTRYHPHRPSLAEETLLVEIS
jgi:hypothetical protein